MAQDEEAVLPYITQRASIPARIVPPNQSHTKAFIAHTPWDELNWSMPWSNFEEVNKMPPRIHNSL